MSHSFKNQEQTSFGLLLQRLFLCRFFSKIVRLNIIMLMFKQNIFMILLFIIKYNILFLLLTLDKSLEQRTVFGTLTFATGARLKQPIYVCIVQRFVWEIYFLLLS